MESISFVVNFPANYTLFTNLFSSERSIATLNICQLTCHLETKASKIGSKLWQDIAAQYSEFPFKLAVFLGLRVAVLLRKISIAATLDYVAMHHDILLENGRDCAILSGQITRKKRKP